MVAVGLVIVNRESVVLHLGDIAANHRDRVTVVEEASGMAGVAQENPDWVIEKGNALPRYSRVYGRTRFVCATRALAARISAKSEVPPMAISSQT